MDPVADEVGRVGYDLSRPEYLAGHIREHIDLFDERNRISPFPPIERNTDLKGRIIQPIAE